jgi:hypothetical protein
MPHSPASSIPPPTVFQAQTSKVRRPIPTAHGSFYAQKRRLKMQNSSFFVQFQFYFQSSKPDGESTRRNGVFAMEEYFMYGSLSKAIVPGFNQVELFKSALKL